MGFRVSPEPLLHSPPFSTGVGDFPEPDTSLDLSGRYSTSDTHVRMRPDRPALSPCLMHPQGPSEATITPGSTLSLQSAPYLTHG